MTLRIFFVIFVTLLNKGDSCSFSSALIGSWSSSNYETITITSSTITLGQIPFTLSSGRTNAVFSCNSTSGLTYAVRSDGTLTFSGQQGYAFICLAFTQVNSNSYFFYMNGDKNSIFGNERMSYWTENEAPSFSQVCAKTAPIKEFNSMVKVGSEASAKTNCPSSMFADYTYSCSGSTGQLEICTDRQTLVFNTSLCSSPYMYSADGRLGCIASTSDDTASYVGLYNYDTTVTNFNNYRFVCITITTSGSDIIFTAEPRRCEGTTSTAFTLTSYNTCPIVEDPTVNVVAIVLGVIFGIIFIILLALLIWWCCKKKKKRDKQKAHIQRNLKIFEKKMAMDEFDDEHPLNETSLVPDYPQNGYPMPLPLRPSKSKRYSVPSPRVTDAEIQTERSFGTGTGMDPDQGPLTERSHIIPGPGHYNGPFSERGHEGLAGQTKSFHGSNRSLSTTKETSRSVYDNADQPQTVISSNKTLTQKFISSIQNNNEPDFPTEPQYLPWPWRTANRAMKNSHSTQSVYSNKSRKGIKDLADFTIKNYGIKYDDTLSDLNKHPPPRRPLSRASSVIELSRPATRMLEMKKSYSTEHLNRSKTSFDHYAARNKKPPPRSKTRLEVKTRRPPFSTSMFHQRPPTKPNAPSRRASIASVKNIMKRSNTRMLNTISESRENIPSPFRKRKPPIPVFMRPLTRSRTTAPPTIKKAAAVYGRRPATASHHKQQALSMLQTKLKHYGMEHTPRRKKYRKKKSSWKSPFSLPSSLKSGPISLKSFSKSSKVQPTKSSRTTSKLNESLNSRDYWTTDQEVTSDSTSGENFMDAEQSKLPAIEKPHRTSKAVSKPVKGAPIREKTYSKKISEDSGISADESALSSDDTRFPLPDITEHMTTKPGMIKPPQSTKKPWH